MSGWIKLHRKFIDHWLYTKEKRPFTFREAWLDILLMVNNAEEKVNFSYQLFKCNPGESLKSIKTWANRWRWSESKVRRFLKLLEQDQMIKIEKVGSISTRLIVCNWETYQINGRASGEQVESKWRASGEQVETNKNDKNKKNIYAENSIEFQLVIFAIKQIQKSHPKLSFNKTTIQKACDDFEKLIRLDGKHPKEIKQVLEWLPNAPRKNEFCWADQVRSPLKFRRKNKDDIMCIDMLIDTMEKKKKVEYL